MSGRTAPMTDTELDRALTGWFAHGPETLPTGTIAAALREVTTTRQDRPIRRRAARSVRSGSRVPALIAAGVAVAVIAGIAIGIDPALVGLGPTATASPAPTPSASPPPSEGSSTPITAALDGFSIVLPGDWHWAARRWPGTQRFEDRGADRSLTVALGKSVIEGGTVGTCAPKTGEMVECNDLKLGYSIPYSTDRSLEALDGALNGFLDRCFGRCPITRTETKLGPDQAFRLELTIDDRHLTYIAAMHGYRPVILSWDEASAVADPAVIEALRTSFAYVGEDPTATPLVYADPLAPHPFRNEAAGYVVDLPVKWTEGVVPDETVMFDGLTILAGDSEGRLTLCSAYHWACGDEPITTLEALEAAVISKPLGLPSTETHTDTTLGGEPARIESVTPPHGYLLGPTAFYSVYAIHNGRPYVLAFDHWKIRRGDFDPSWVDGIVKSFRFLD